MFRCRIAKAVTGMATAPTVASRIAVRRIERVAPKTVGLPSVTGSHVVAPQDVLAKGHERHVGWVHAMSDSAEVVNGEGAGYRAVSQFPRHSVRLHMLGTKSERSITCRRDAGEPGPTVMERFGASDLAPESLFKIWAPMDDWRSVALPHAVVPIAPATSRRSPAAVFNSASPNRPLVPDGAATSQGVPMPPTQLATDDEHWPVAVFDIAVRHTGQRTR